MLVAHTYGRGLMASDKTRDDARRHVIESINDDRLSVSAHEEFDIEGIITELQELTGDYDFDDITTDQFMQIVLKHDNSREDRS